MGYVVEVVHLEGEVTRVVQCLQDGDDQNTDVVRLECVNEGYWK